LLIPGMYVVVSPGSGLHLQLVAAIRGSHEIVTDPLLAESDASECTSDHEYPEGTEEIRVLIDCL
jgi:hypothetical protein